MKVQLRETPRGWQLVWVNQVWGKFDIIVGRAKPTYPEIVRMVKAEETVVGNRALSGNKTYM